MDPITMGAVALGGKLVDNVIQYYTNKNSQKQAQANTRKNMQEQVGLEDSSWYNRIAKSTQALKAAGLSPALMTGQTQGAATATPTASPMPQVGQPSSQADLLNSMMLNKSQQELNEAAAKKANAEAEEISLKNEHTLNKDYFINTHLGQVLENLRDNAEDEFTRGFAESFINENRSAGNNIRFDQGALDAFKSIFYDMERSKRVHFIEELTNHFDRKVMSMQLDNGAAAALANLSKDQRRLIYKQMLQMDASIAKLQSDVTLNDKQKQFLESQISRTGQEIQSMLHSDPVAMYNSGDIGDLAVKLGFEGTTQFLHGVGFGTGMAVGSKLVPGSKGSSVPFDVPKFGSKSADPSVMPKNVFEQIKNSAAKQANGDKVYEARLIDASVRRWKAEHK